MKDLIIGFSILWLLPWSIIVTRLLIFNLKKGYLVDYEERKNKK